jgi:hypothetical protein
LKINSLLFSQRRQNKVTSKSLRISKASFDERELEETFRNSKFFKELAYEKANEILEESKSQLIDEFENHPVTQELEAGPEAQNTSGLLGGYGNLFSFIGFNQGENPVNAVKNALSKIRALRGGIRTSRSSKGVAEAQVRINVKEIANISEKTPMPWEAGRSWLFAIERGISGFGQYLYGKFNSSRSGSGVQASRSIRSGAFVRTSYFSKMYSNFLKRIGLK